MVCRVFLTTPPGELQVLFETVNPAPSVAPNYNAAPRQRLPVVRLDRTSEARSLDLIQWGVPFPGPSGASAALRINVTGETVATNSAYRDAFEHRRCLVPVDGFYVWHERPDGTKQPHAIMSTDRAPLALAGLWDEWRGSATIESVRTFTIITVPSNEQTAPINNRMPAILPREEWFDWLGERRASTDNLLAMLRFYPAELMEAHAVSERVGNVRNNDASLIQSLA